MRVISLILCLALTACGVNPVTGKREMQFVSEQQEIKLGEQHYLASRQSQGGDFEVLPDVTQYVNAVGQKLAAVADRKLPYEFVVRYVIKGGFLDGRAGFIYATLSSYYVWLKFVKLLDIERRSL